VSQLTVGRSERGLQWTDGPADSGRAKLPIVLGTLASRVTAEAEQVAFDSALENASPLIVANMLRLPPYPTTIMLLGAGAATLPHEEDLEAVRATADRAAALGLKTELLRISSPRPVKALLELLSERRAGLLVFGPDPERVSARRLRSAAQTLARDAPCLVWIPALDQPRP
jgi:hypothetical protein